MTPPTVTQTFAGKAAGFYISADLQAIVSLDDIARVATMHYTIAAPTLGAANVVLHTTCDFPYQPTVD